MRRQSAIAACLFAGAMLGFEVGNQKVPIDLAEGQDVVINLR